MDVKCAENSAESLKSYVIRVNGSLLEKLDSEGATDEAFFDELSCSIKSLILMIQWRLNAPDSDVKLRHDLTALCGTTLLDVVCRKTQIICSLNESSSEDENDCFNIISNYLRESLEHFCDTVLYAEKISVKNRHLMELFTNKIENLVRKYPGVVYETRVFLKLSIFFRKYVQIFGTSKSANSLKKALTFSKYQIDLKDWLKHHGTGEQSADDVSHFLDSLQWQQCEKWLDLFAEHQENLEAGGQACGSRDEIAENPADSQPSVFVIDTEGASVDERSFFEEAQNAEKSVVESTAQPVCSTSGLSLSPQLVHLIPRDVEEGLPTVCVDSISSGENASIEIVGPLAVQSKNTSSCEIDEVAENASENSVENLQIFSLYDSVKAELSAEKQKTPELIQPAVFLRSESIDSVIFCQNLEEEKFEEKSVKPVFIKSSPEKSCFDVAEIMHIDQHSNENLNFSENSVENLLAHSISLEEEVNFQKKVHSSAEKLKNQENSPKIVSATTETSQRSDVVQIDEEFFAKSPENFNFSENIAQNANEESVEKLISPASDNFTIENTKKSETPVKFALESPEKPVSVGNGSNFVDLAINRENLEILENSENSSKRKTKNSLQKIVPPLQCNFTTENTEKFETPVKCALKISEKPVGVENVSNFVDFAINREKLENAENSTNQKTQNSQQKIAPPIDSEPETGGQKEISVDSTQKPKKVVTTYVKSRNSWSDLIKSACEWKSENFENVVAGLMLDTADFSADDEKNEKSPKKSRISSENVTPSIEKMKKSFTDRKSLRSVRKSWATTKILEKNVIVQSESSPANKSTNQKRREEKSDSDDVNANSKLLRGKFPTTRNSQPMNDTLKDTPTKKRARAASSIFFDQSAGLQKTPEKSLDAGLDKGTPRRYLTRSQAKPKI